MANQGKSVKDPVKIPQSNPFDALCDGDSGDDAVVKAAEQVKQQASVCPKADNSKKGKDKVNNTVAASANNNVNSRGRYSNGQRGNVNSSRGGYSQYRNGTGGQRGTGYYNQYQNQYGGNGQSAGSNGYNNNRNQNTLYRTVSSSRSSNGTDDGASDKAERSSVKSEREIKEEEFQKKLEEYKYDPEKEDESRKFLAKFPDILTGTKTAEEREKLLNQKAKHLEIVRLSDSKKMTLDEYEKVREEQRKALRASGAERRVVESSAFDGFVVVSKKNLEDDDSLSLTSVHKQKMESEKTEKSQKKKKKNAPLLVFGGSQQSQGHFFSEQQDQAHGRGRGRGRGGYNHDQTFDRGAAVHRQFQSPSLDSQDTFPGLHPAPEA